MANRDRIEALRQLLTHPMRSNEICAALGISQSVFSRFAREVPGLVALGAARARRYALARAIPGVVLPMAVTAVSATGQPEAMGMLHALQGGWYALAAAGSNDYWLFQGLPPFVQDLRPQGFLGRLEPLKHADLKLPADILRWSDDHVLTHLSRRSDQAAGNLILGCESLARYWEARRLDQRPVCWSDRAHAYPALAQDAMNGEPAGSSAGGEQPKFTCQLREDDGGDAADIVDAIVKFSPPTTTPGGRRWADLLICEHLALSTLHDHGVPAAHTSVLTSQDRVFLQVTRFDRAGRHGRLPMVTLAALDGALGMLDQSWTAVAATLLAQRQLPADDAARIEVLDLFGALIGNVDKHHGNLAVSWEMTAHHRLLPAYDVLPMLYRPNTHGEVSDRFWSALSLRGMALAHLPRCYPMARTFWQRVIADLRISADFRQIAARHMDAIAALDPCG